MKLVFFDINVYICQRGRVRKLYLSKRTGENKTGSPNGDFINFPERGNQEQ